MKYTLPLKIVSTANMRESWQARHRRAKLHRSTAYTLTPKMTMLPSCILLTRIGPKLLDTDNLAGGFKAVRDGIADKLRIDDGDERVQWFYDQRTGKPKEFSAEVEFDPPLGPWYGKQVFRRVNGYVS
jgi:hypothetical protein